MGEFKLGRMTLRSLFSKPATEAYPVEPRQYFPQTKGHVTIEIDKCRFDGSCAMLCPTEALEVDRAEMTWAINRFRCIQCRNCVNVCVENALTMENTYAPSASEKHVDVFALSEESRAARKAAEAEKRARAQRMKEEAMAKKKAAAAAKAAGPAAAEAGEAPKEAGTTDAAQEGAE